MEKVRLCPGCMRRLTEGRREDHKEETSGREKHAWDGQREYPTRCPFCGFSLFDYKQNPRCLPLNTILAGKYLVGKVLGEGGFGITYMGYDLNMKTRIAIKEYFPVELVSRDTTRLTEGGGSDRVISLSGEKSRTYQQGLKKYVDEARNVSQFSGTPGIVSVKDFFYENDTAYIVMEYIEGVSLKEYLKQKGGRLSEEEALAILRPVLEALEKVHGAGIVHRDISPDNIMLTFAGERGASGESGASGEGGAAGTAAGTAGIAAEAAGTAAGAVRTIAGADGAVYGSIAAVRLIDFGAARMTAKNDQKSLTIILKHGYAPEEQYRSHGEQGPWTDVYALCAVLYRMLTGKVPEPAMDRLFSDGLKRPEELGTAVSPAVSEAIMRGLAVKKDGRIQTVRELSDALYGGKKLKKNRSGKRKWLPWAAGTAAVLTAAAVFLFAGTGNGQRQEAAEAALAETVPGLSERNAAEEERETTAPAENDAAESENLMLLEEDGIGEAIAFYSPRTAVSNLSGHTLFCLPDGTVEARGSNAYGQCMTQDWRNMVAVAAGQKHSLGLRADGRVYAAGDDYYGQCQTGSWSRITAVAAGYDTSFGLCADGTVVACGDVERYADEVASWTDIRAIAVLKEDRGLVALNGDGHILYAGVEEEMPEISGWDDVEWIDCGYMQGWDLIGLTEDGRVRTAQLAEYTPYVSGDYEETLYYGGLDAWEDISQISITGTPVIGVKKDGTVVFGAEADERLQEEVGTWTGLLAAVSVSSFDSPCVMGLQEDGTLLQYVHNSGNTQLADMKSLSWVQAVEDGMEGGILAGTADGQLLTYGSGILIDSLERELQARGISHGDFAGYAGTWAYQSKNGTIYGRDFEESWSEPNVIQGIQLWYNSFQTGAYALLTRDNQVKIKTYGKGWADAPDFITEEMERARKAEQWTDVVQIVGNDGWIFGLHSDGTVSTTVEWYEALFADVTGVRKLASYENRAQEIYGLMEDHTVRNLLGGEDAVSTGRTQAELWENVADIAVGESHIAGLLADGTVVAAGSNHAGQCEVEDWENIVYLAAGRSCTLGITADGDLKMAGSLY